MSGQFGGKLLMGALTSDAHICFSELDGVGERVPNAVEAVPDGVG